MAGQPETRGLAREAIGSARLTAFGVSNVAPAGAVAGGLVIVVAYAGFAAPLVVLIALVASLCCAVSIAEFARRLPSAALYTYNSCGLGETAGFLTGWMMVFAYALYVRRGRGGPVGTVRLRKPREPGGGHVAANPESARNVQRTVTRSRVRCQSYRFATMSIWTSRARAHNAGLRASASCSQAWRSSSWRSSAG